MTTTEDEAWVPQACTLPTVERPLRLAEFDDLFATALRGQQRLSATALRWDLDPAVEATAQDLTGRESSAARSSPLPFTRLLKAVDAERVRTIHAGIPTMCPRSISSDPPPRPPPQPLSAVEQEQAHLHAGQQPYRVVSG